MLCVLLVAGIVLNTGCAPSSPKKIASDTLFLRLGGEPTFLNPVLSTDSPSSSVNGFIYNGLLRVNESLELEPDLAESYVISEDGLTYTFKLKPNVKWHDGQSFSAHDVKFTFDTILNPKTNTVRRSNYIIDGQPIQFSVVDELTFQAKLPKPFAPFLVHMGMGIIPKHLFENVDVNKAEYNRSPIGTGPFKFQNW